VIEKHFTLDRNAPGPDHKVSMDPAELRQLIENLRLAEASMGNGDKRPFETECRNRELSRRSVVTAARIPAGRRIAEQMLTFKRPGTGIAPGEAHKLIGMRARRELAADTILSWDDLEPTGTSSLSQHASESQPCVK
jgi:N,N'-diacetyllegionaminate synthase